MFASRDKGQPRMLAIKITDAPAQNVKYSDSEAGK
jgi:hypothetical protein